jgi:hypothetical protein
MDKLDTDFYLNMLELHRRIQGNAEALQSVFYALRDSMEDKTGKLHQINLASCKLLELSNNMRDMLQEFSARHREQDERAA